MENLKATWTIFENGYKKNFFKNVDLSRLILEKFQVNFQEYRNLKNWRNFSGFLILLCTQSLENYSKLLLKFFNSYIKITSYFFHISKVGPKFFWKFHEINIKIFQKFVRIISVIFSKFSNFFQNITPVSQIFRKYLWIKKLRVNFHWDKCNFRKEKYF